MTHSQIQQHLQDCVDGKKILLNMNMPVNVDSIDIKSMTDLILEMQSGHGISHLEFIDVSQYNRRNELAQASIEE